MIPSAAFRKERSQHGETLSALKSGLQKYVRRGMASRALWCLGELMSIILRAPERERVPPIRTNVLHRLMIVFLEDVGDPTHWNAVEAYRALSVAGHSAAYVGWVETMSELRKARSCSHARAVARAIVADKPLDGYPSLQETSGQYRGDHRKDVEALWRDVLRDSLQRRDPVAVVWAWKIATEGLVRTTKYGRLPVWQVFAVIAEVAEPHLAALVPLAVQWHKELSGLDEKYMCWMVLVWAQVMGVKPGARAARMAAPSPAEDAECEEMFCSQGALALDAFVLDMHTRSSRKKGDLTAFAIEGSHVENENTALVNSEWKRFYVAEKLAADTPAAAATTPVAGATTSLVAAAVAASAAPVARETEYDYVVRTQLTTSQSKTDVYFAREPETKKLVVLKGPFACKEPVDNAINMYRWKVKSKLPAARVTPVLLIPDRWPEGIPLGIRNKIDRTRPAWFLASEPLRLEPFPTMEHSSKVWPKTVIVDWSRSNPWKPLDNWHAESFQAKTDYVLALLARYFVGIGDLADRNFLEHGGRVYSLDEDGRTAGEVSLSEELKRGKCALVLGLLPHIWPVIQPIIAEWEPEAFMTKGAAERLAIISTLNGVKQLF